MTPTIRRILVPVDFSEPSIRALDYAIEFARLFKAEIVVLHVVDAVYPVMADVYAPGYAAGLVSQELERAGREQLARLAATMEKRHVTVRCLQSMGPAYEMIVAVAKKVKTDMIIMSTQGRTGLSHLLMGSVAERVVRGATCPVLTVRGTSPGGKRSSARPARAVGQRHRHSTRSLRAASGR